MKRGIARAVLTCPVVAPMQVSADALKEFRCGRTLQTQGGLPNRWWMISCTC